MSKIPTVKLALIKKFSDDTEAYIKIKVWVPGIDRRVGKSTKYKIPVSMWNAAEEIVKKSYPGAADINREILKEKNKIIDRFTDDLKNDVEFTEAYIKFILKEKKGSGEFLSFYWEYLELIKSKFTDAYYKHFLIEYNYLADFAGNNIRFSDINTKFLERYEISLTSKGKKCAPTTKYGKMKKLKEVIERAIAHELMGTGQVAAYSWPTEVKTEKPYLTLGQTEDLGNAIYNGDFNDDAELKTIACYFLIECYAGIRFSDWSRFEIETLINDRNLKVRAKKNGEPIYLPLNIFKRLGKIIDYVQNQKIKFNSTETNTNRLLKIIAKQVKPPIQIHLTSHIGRHTCGTLLGEMGYTTAEIAEVLGISEETAKTYVKRTRQGLQNAFAKYGGL